MKTVFLVGNGFDLAAGLATQPRRFLEYVLDHAEDVGAPVGAVELAKAIKTEGIESWEAYERKMGEYAAEFSIDAKEDYLDQVDALCNLLGRWLAEKERLISDSFVDQNYENCLKSMALFQSELPRLQQKMFEGVRAKHVSENWNFDIVCFNYTDLLARMHQKLYNENKVLRGLSTKVCVLEEFVQAHGSLDYGSVICGVDNAGQIANEGLATDPEVVRTLVKSETQKEVLHEEDDAVALSLISQADIMCVFGMSYGLTDGRWWRALLDRLRTSEQTLLVLFSFGPGSKEANYSPRAIDKQANRVIDSFLAGCGEAEIEPEAKRRIIVANSSLVFPFKSKLQDDMATER